MISFLEAFSPVFSWLVRTSICAMATIGLILLVQRLWRKSISPRGQYVLWLLLLLQLACPWIPQTPISVENLLPPVRHALAPLHWSAPAQVGSEPAISTSALPVGSERAEASLSSHAVQSNIVLPVAIAIWLSGMAVLAAMLLWQALGMVTAIRRQRPVTDQKTLDLLEDCKAEVGVYAYLAIVETPRVRSPSLFGFIRPKLLMPVGAAESISPDRLRHVFLHELAHLKRRDILTGWLMAVLQILYWFNPLIWYAFYRIRADRELACDALVLSQGETKAPAEYGRTLILLLEKFSCTAALPNLAGIMEDGRLMHRRIAMIAQFRPPTHRRSAFAAAAVVLVGAVALTNAQPFGEEVSRALQQATREAAKPAKPASESAGAEGGPGNDRIAVVVHRPGTDASEPEDLVVVLPASKSIAAFASSPWGGGAAVGGDLSQFGVYCVKGRTVTRIAPVSAGQPPVPLAVQSPENSIGLLGQAGPAWHAAAGASKFGQLETGEVAATESVLNPTTRLLLSSGMHPERLANGEHNSNVPSATSVLVPSSPPLQQGPAASTHWIFIPIPSRPPAGNGGHSDLDYLNTSSTRDYLAQAVTCGAVEDVLLQSIELNDAVPVLSPHTIYRYGGPMMFLHSDPHMYDGFVGNDSGGQVTMSVMLPEPASLTLLLAGGLMLCRRRYR